MEIYNILQQLTLSQIFNSVWDQAYYNKLTIKAANIIVRGRDGAGIGHTTKMNCYSWGIPTDNCKTGRQLAKDPNSSCHGCYARRGNYMYASTRNAMRGRLEQLSDPRWIEAISYLINKRNQPKGQFRWFDSGDLQNHEHLLKILEVVKHTPQVKHWLPTQEHELITEHILGGWDIPENITIRLSARLVDINISDWIAQPKLDGIRTTLSHIGNKYELNGEEGTKKSYQYPEVVMGAIQSGLPDDTILDGELCILENNYYANLYSLLSRQVGSLSKATKLASVNPATFVAFDIIKYKDKSLEDLSWQARNDILQSLTTNNNFNIIASYHPLDLVKKIKPFNMEGMVLKRKTGSYNTKWLKMKYYEEYDFKIIGTTSKSRIISSLELENTTNGNYVGKVNSNSLISQTTEFAKSIIGKTATVRCRMNDKGNVREPVLVRIK